MKVRVEDAGSCRKVLHIEVPKEDVSTEYGGILKLYAKSARIPGFRPGRAPDGLVEKHFAKNIAQDTRDQVVPKSYRAAVEQEKIKPVAVIDVRHEAIQKDQAFFFDVILDVEPEFDLPSYKGMAIAGRKIEVSERDVDNALERLRDRMARYEDITGRPAQKGDLVQIDYSGTCDGQPVGDLGAECAPLGQGKDFWAVMEDDGGLLPGLAEKLAGANAGDRRSVSIEFPQDYRLNPLAGKTAAYEVTVKAIREKILPAVDAAFLKGLEAESVDALRKQMRESLVKVAESEESRRIRGEIIRKLIEQTPIKDLPQSLVQTEADHIVRDIVYENAVRGASREQIEERKDDILTAATQSSAERVKLTHILTRIAEKEGIGVEDREVDQQIQVMAARHRVQPAQMKAELEKRDQMESIRGDLRVNKALDFLVANAKVEVAA